MLVLTRETGQSVLIGDKIKVMVTKVKEGKVRLGITAPESDKILREELLLTRRHEGPLQDDDGPCGVPGLLWSSRDKIAGEPENDARPT